MRRAIGAWRACLLLLSTSTLVCACVQGQPATDTGDPGFPFGPSAVGVQPIAYVQDIKPIFDRDCLNCHGDRRAAGNYSVRSYADTIAGQRAGDASSSVVFDCSPGWDLTVVNVRSGATPSQKASASSSSDNASKRCASPRGVRMRPRSSADSR